MKKNSLFQNHIKSMKEAKINNTNTQIHDCSLSWLGTDTEFFEQFRQCDIVYCILSPLL